MKPITTITKWLHIGVATLVVWAQNYIQTVFEEIHARDLYLLGVLFLAIIGIEITDRFAVAAIDHSQLLRMLMAGRDDIEGDWVNINVSTSDPTRVLAAEYCRIRYNAGEYKLSGDTWSLDGKWIEDFTTEGSNYQKREYEYYYKTGINRVGGFGIILFSPHDSLPTDFVCRYVDENVKVPQFTRGRRVSRRLKRVSQDQRRDAALEFARNFDQLGLLDFNAFLHR